MRTEFKLFRLSVMLVFATALGAAALSVSCGSDSAGSSSTLPTQVSTDVNS